VCANFQFDRFIDAILARVTVRDKFFDGLKPNIVARVTVSLRQPFCGMRSDGALSAELAFSTHDGARRRDSTRRACARSRLVDGCLARVLSEFAHK